MAMSVFVLHNNYTLIENKYHGWDKNKKEL